MRKRKTIAVIIVWALFFLACSRYSSSPSNNSAGTREFTDDVGRRIAVADQVNRVVSLAPNLTEIVFAVGAGDRLVGDTTYCDYPPEATKVAKVGDTLHPSIERIIALRPQLVLVSTASQLEAFTRQLDAHHIAVFVTDPQDLSGVFRSIKQVGEILNRRRYADELVEQLQARVDAVADAVRSRPPVRIFYQLSAEPLYTAGHDAFVTDLIKRAGATSVTADVPGAWPKFSAESALAAQPEAILLPSGGSMGNANSSVADALKRSRAVINGRVYRINDDLLSRPGPRAVDGLEEMARALHPEAFR